MIAIWKATINSKLVVFFSLAGSSFWKNTVRSVDDVGHWGERNWSTDTTDTENTALSTEQSHTALIYPRSTTMARPDCTDDWSTSQRSGCRSCCMLGCDHPKSVKITAPNTHTFTASSVPSNGRPAIPVDNFQNTCAWARSDRVSRGFGAPWQSMLCGRINMDSMLCSGLVPSWSLSTIDVVRQRSRSTTVSLREIHKSSSPDKPINSDNKRPIYRKSFIW